MSRHVETLSQEQRSKRILTFTFTVIAIFYVLPIMLVLINSMKSNSYVNMETFALPNANSFVGLDNYKTGMTFGNYPFLKSALYSLFITVTSSVLILICTSMAAWYIARVGSLFGKIVYYLCVFSMVVPFQMVMFTLAKTADTLKLNTPWTIPIVYLGFGAGLAVFMFTGFVKSIPLEIEEAAAIDGSSFSNTLWRIILPMCKPILVTVAIIQIFSCWNEFSFALVLIEDVHLQTVPLARTQFKGQFGSDYPKQMAAMLITMLPIVILYFIFSKQIIKGMVAGAVKG